MQLSEPQHAIPDIDWSAVDPDHADLPYEERLLEAMTPRMAAILEIGRAAYLAAAAKHGDTGTCGFSWVIFEVSAENKPYIRWLSEEDIGRWDGWNLYYTVGLSDVLEDGDTLFQSLTLAEAACEAMATAFQQIGVSVYTKSVVD